MTIDESRVLYRVTDVTVTQEQYAQAAVAVARRFGGLKYAPLLSLPSAVLLLAGLSSVTSFRSTYQSLLTPLLLVGVGIVLLAVVWWLCPRLVREQAARDYAVYAAVRQPTTVWLERDVLHAHTPCLQDSDPYATMAQLLELPTLLVFVREGGRLLVVPKQQLPSAQAEEILEFLRHTFVRRYRLMRH